MKSKASAHLSQQYGLSLIGLLIGLLISVLCILASLTLYKNLIHVATESKLDSSHDGQLASAMLVVQLEVQSAGYGIDDANFDHIVVPASPTGEIRLLWRFSTDGGSTFECRGFLEEKNEEGGVFRELKLIKVSSGCNGTSPLSGFTWVDVSVLGRWRIVDNATGLGQYVTAQNTMFSFDLSSSKCNPYGASGNATETHGFLTVTAPGSAFLHGAADMTANVYEFCLPNIYLASP